MRPVLSTAIMHAPWSSERAENLVEILAQLPSAIVIRDDDRRGMLALGKRLGSWPMAERAWRSSSAEATHHLVLEDDAHLCDGFVDLALNAITARPDAALSLFRGKRACSVGTVLPVASIAPWLSWVSSSPESGRHLPHHDCLIDAGMRRLSVPHFYTVPSLVEHRQMESLLKHDHVRALRFEQCPSTVHTEMRGL